MGNGPNWLKPLHLEIRMYRKDKSGQLKFEDFYLPFGGKLRSDNRWVKLSKIIPWEEIEDKYADNFSEDTGAPAKSSRIALGALIIKERCGFSDEETVEQITENPYLQFFIGLSEFTDEPPFDPSMMVYFRKRMNIDIVREINERVISGAQVKKEEADSKDKDDNNDSGSGNNNGKLIVDATCTPADIRYPTDLSLLNESREKLEKIINTLHAPFRGMEKKPRTYCKKARKDYLKVAKKRKRRYNEIRKAIGKQLRYIFRNLGYIKALKEKSSLRLLSKRQYKNLLVINELFRQQKEMYDNRTKRVDFRIVSISQPHVRPIVRGKVSAPTEFGAKISVSLVDGFARIEELQWDNYNESTGLIDEIEKYKNCYGVFPESVHVDQIYRTRGNREYCKEHNIRLSGPALGRPKKGEKKRKNELEKKDLRERISIEGKFGQGKRRFSLARIMGKLPITSESIIGIIFLVMNLERRLRLLFVRLLSQYLNENFHSIKNKLIHSKRMELENRHFYLENYI